MIGVAKNQNDSRFERMSRMSRKWTVSADRISAQPGVKIELHHHDQRETQQLADRQRRVEVDQEHDQDRQRRGRNGSCSPVTVTIGRISAGNRTFLIRLPPEISTPDDSVSDAANQVHGSSPQNMNSE